MSKLTVSKQEVAELLKGAIRGDVGLKLDGPSWDEVPNGTVTFLIGGQRISFRLDDGNLDYAEAAQWADGRKGKFDGWPKTSDPVDLLSDEEYEDLESTLSAVSALCCNYPEPILN